MHRDVALRVPSARIALAAIACAIACSSPAAHVDSPPPVAAATVAAVVPLSVRATARVAAPCGPDYLERHATSVSDLDGDGTLDRVAITREADALAVRLYELPSLREKGSWKLVPANGYVELATPRRRGTTRGDLWITVGAHADKPWDGSTAAWTETLYHLEDGELVAVTTGYRDMRIRVDVDGDGRVDPIGSGGGVVRALVAGGEWLELPVVLSSHVHGAPAPNEQQEAIDLDGNGVRELVIERDDAIAIVEVPSRREVWSVEGKPWKPSLVRWAGAYVLVVRLDGTLRVYETGASHALIAEYRDAASYTDVVATLGTQLALHGHPWQFFDRENPATSIGTVWQLVRRLDDATAPYGPVRLAGDDSLGLLAVHGEPLQAMELWLVDPKTHAKQRPIWQSEPMDDMSERVNASLVDIDRDGASELLLEYVTSTVFHHGASWNTSRMQLVDGAGALLWAEPETRTEEWVHEDDELGSSRQTRFDGTHVRAFDLGDGTTPLRVRSVRDEYYLLPGTSKIAAVPPCLE